ncbi:nitrogen fixation protein [Candidatus Malacoplasma girerdii]|uniref:Nitrogen fixation protein n=1 Tax=Candidatus Malacoplasma girerdii TaxID=1318617 RepID=A0A097SSN1_9BACT|nr:nitrogen fixation protein [Candidatus Malacoplasma girerdii]
MKETNENKTLQEIHDLLATVRVYINYDGGDVEFVSYLDHTLTLKVTGACATCPFNGEEFDSGIKEVFKNEIKDIHDVQFIY